MAHSGHTFGQFVARAREIFLLPAAIVKDVIAPSDTVVIDDGLGQSSSALTGLTIETETALFDRLTLMAYACRQSRWAMSLAIVEIDEFPKLILTHGPRPAARLARSVHELCTQCGAPESSLVPLRQYRFALALVDCNHRCARRICQKLVDDAREIAAAEGLPDIHLSLSIGVTSVSALSPHFAPQPLLKSSLLCLWAAQLAGGNAVKSSAPN